jgi:squalene synthase HpnC
MIDHRMVRSDRLDAGGALSATSRPLDAHERSENFPVALRFLPRQHRRDLRAVYAFARGVDEVGDTSDGDRTASLRRLDRELGRIWTGGPISDPVLVELGRTVRAHDLPAEPFHRLVEANLQDQVVTRYPTYDDLLGYCRLSADPVGRIVLGVFGQSGSDLTVELSDRVCTALQLLEHWQDVAEDRRAGRVYLPQEDLRAHGVSEDDLDAPAASPEVAALMRFEIDRAARLLEDGAGIVGRLHGWARPCVAGFVAGGRATAAALRRTDGDVLGRPATPSKAGTAGRLLALWAGAGMGGGR